MIEVKGKPLARVGRADLDCDTSLSVPDQCASCRQVDRWMPRTQSWAKAQVSRFKAIVRAILQEHDDILKSYCGNCFAQEAPGCECFIADWQLIGLPLRVETKAPGDCVQFTTRRTVAVDCYIKCPTAPDAPCVTFTAPDPDIPTCWQSICASQCQPCELVTLDPCNNPDHLDIMMRVYAAKMRSFGLKGTGPAIVELLGILFPGSAPQILKAEFGHIYATIDRPFSEIEQQFFPLLVSVIPLGIGVQLHFLTACTE